MGLQIREIVPRRPIQIKDLKNKTICIDAYNIIYQFLSNIRQPDGTPLKDSKGRITSHLSGLFYRNVNLIEDGLKIVYVFDGKPPELKGVTGEIREERKDEAAGKYAEARKEGDGEGMGRYARQMVRITREIVEESKELLTAMGIAVVQAPSEGESQAAYLARTDPQGIYAVGSQDYDCLLFGAPRLIQNLTLSQRRKTASGGYVEVFPELIEMERVLNHLQINIDQLICIGILCGTDYNPGGVRGIGPKRALQIVKLYKQPVLIFESAMVRERMAEMGLSGGGFDWKAVFELFHKPNVDTTARIEFPKVELNEVRRILLEREFSEERINKQLERLEKAVEQRKQRTLF